MNEFTLTGEFETPTKYHFVEILEGMCELRNIKSEVKSKPLNQSTWQRLINGKREIISFVITGEKYQLNDLNYTLTTIFKDYNGHK